MMSTPRRMLFMFLFLLTLATCVGDGPAIQGGRNPSTLNRLKSRHLIRSCKDLGDQCDFDEECCWLYFCEIGLCQW
uniref:Ctr_150_TN conopeptide n=1 Tax=Conus tribblei TaxID=101761 RepID=A0A0C9RYD9_CONTD